MMFRYHYFIAEGVYDSIINSHPSSVIKQERLSEYLTEDENYRFTYLMQNVKLQGRGSFMKKSVFKNRSWQG